ncbi:MAG TPA: hypothetical protein VM942_08135 [Acidimicrobiales bacterium]|nr:hypothetical protein [Acidimicrobiales bacterium]
MDGPGQRFAIRFGWAMGVLMRALGLGPRRSYVELDGVRVRVRMGWGFRADLLRSSIVDVRPRPYVWWAYGVHYAGRGRWIVNGSGHDVVRLVLDPPGRARTLGAPIRVREVWVSLEEPESFRIALGR